MVVDDNPNKFSFKLLRSETPRVMAYVAEFPAIVVFTRLTPPVRVPEALLWMVNWLRFSELPRMVSEKESVKTPVFMSREKLRSVGDVTSGVNTETCRPALGETGLRKKSATKVLLN